LVPTGTAVASDATRDANAVAFIAGNDAPLIGDRAATRGRCATEDGDEPPVLKSALSIRAPASRTASNSRHRESFNAAGGAALPEGGWMNASRPHSAAIVAATTRRSSANARAHATEGGDEHAWVESALNPLGLRSVTGVAMRTPVRRARYRFALRRLAHETHDLSCDTPETLIRFAGT
jgi:hypothetical protein